MVLSTRKRTRSPRVLIKYSQYAHYEFQRDDNSRINSSINQGTSFEFIKCYVTWDYKKRRRTCVTRSFIRIYFKCKLICLF